MFVLQRRRLNPMTRCNSSCTACHMLEGRSFAANDALLAKKQVQRHSKHHLIVSVVESRFCCPCTRLVRHIWVSSPLAWGLADDQNTSAKEAVQSPGALQYAMDMTSASAGYLRSSTGLECLPANGLLAPASKAI